MWKTVNVCFECDDAITDNHFEGDKEASRRVAEGEYLTDLYIEYNNKLHELLEKEYSEYADEEF